MAPGKNKIAADSEAEEESSASESKATEKRCKSAMAEIAKEFVCPISLELPVVPVTAEDGRVYNRADIQKHIDSAEDDNLRSPVTGSPMGPTLVPAVQVQNTLHALIESGVVDDDSGERLKKVIAMKKKAEAGDPEAMCDLSKWYVAGSNGLHKDDKQAYVWCSKAADSYCFDGMAGKGMMLYHGQGVDQDEVAGTALLVMAACNDHPFACYFLGHEYYYGISGLPQDHKLAKYWLRKAHDLVQDDGIRSTCMTDDDFEDCETMLKELEGASQLES